MQVVNILMAKMSKCPSIVLQVECNRISNQLAYTKFLIVQRNVQPKNFRTILLILLEGYDTKNKLIARLIKYLYF